MGLAGPLKQAMGIFFDVATGRMDKESLEMEEFGPVIKVWCDHVTEPDQSSGRQG